MKRHAPQRGFALLMTLALVLIASCVLAGLARWSTAQALEARDAAEELRRRWAVTTCRASLLARAELLLEDAERGEITGEDEPEEIVYRHKPVVTLRIDCELAGDRYVLLLTDEQAKWNVNHLMHRSSRAEAQTRLARFVMENGGAATRVKLRPRVALEDSAQNLNSFGQVFESADPAELLGDDGNQGAGVAMAVTCWGNGLLNIRRADTEVVRQACEKVVGTAAVARLLEVRKRDPYRKLSEMLRQVDRLDAKEREQLERNLTDASACHGLWVIQVGPQRSWYTLAIRQGAPRPRQVSPASEADVPAVAAAGVSTGDWEFSW